MNTTNQLSNRFKFATFLFSSALTVGVGVAQAREHSTAAHLLWPAINASNLSVGAFPDPRDVRRVIVSLPKREVRLLLNDPHFAEGLFEVHEWDYVFNFLTGRGQEYQTCQYKVLFDDKMRVSSTHWRDPSCADYLNEQPKVVPAVIPVAPRLITLNTTGLFKFAGSSMQDLNAKGRSDLENTAKSIAGARAKINSIHVVGHTDRLGVQSNNMALSLGRAATVRQYLVSLGVPVEKISIEGKGTSQPIVQCSNKLPREKLVACLAPNRRATALFEAEQPN